MAEGMLFHGKKPKISRAEITDEQMKSFSQDYPDLYKTLIRSYNFLMFGKDFEGRESNQYILCPAKIISCNAYHDIPFNRSFCYVELYKYGLRFGHVFGGGRDVLFKFLTENKLPLDKDEKAALKKLLSFFMWKKDAVLEAWDATMVDEKGTCLFLMNHLVSQLAACDKWFLDLQIKNKNFFRCSCSTDACPLEYPNKDSFADLSIGNGNVWHGPVDAMTESDAAVQILNSSGGTWDEFDSFTALEFKQPTFQTRDQLLAETIVYSFLHRKFYEEIPFVPVIGFTQGSVNVAVYDSVLDILLTGPEIKFRNVDSVSACIAYLIIWLTINFKYFSTPLYATLSQSAVARAKQKQSNFINFVNEKYRIYEENLKFKAVRRKVPNDLGFFLPPEASAIESFSEDLHIKPH